MHRYTTEEFSKRFSQAESYLKQFEVELKNRNNDNGINWFEYGRSQALTHLNKSKLLISTLITGKVRVYMLDSSTIPTSGIYIITKTNQQNFDLLKAKQILSSESFMEYVKNIGIISNGNSYRISSRDINNFIFSETLLKG